MIQAWSTVHSNLKRGVLYTLTSSVEYCIHSNLKRGRWSTVYTLTSSVEYCTLLPQAWSTLHSNLKRGVLYTLTSSVEYCTL